MSRLAYIIIGAALALSPIIRIISKYGLDDETSQKWMSETPLGEIFRIRVTLLFGAALMLFGLVFAR